MLTMTNATKANIISLVNAILGLLTAFDVAFTEAQKGAIIAVVNAFFAAFVATTYKKSRKRQEL
jgi:uncharacterized MnhB-related membrane protein